MGRSPSIRDTVPSSAFATQTESAPAARAAGPRPTAYWAVMRPLSGSIAPTKFSSIRANRSGAGRG